MVWGPRKKKEKEGGEDGTGKRNKKVREKENWGRWCRQGRINDR